MTSSKAGKKIVVCASNEDKQLKCIAQQLNLPLVSHWEEGADYCLLSIDGKLHLQSFVAGEKVSICVDFSSGEATYRREHGGGKNQAIARAIGLKKLKTVSVLDATAGLGSDAFVLACLGCEVNMLERSEIVASLLGDGLRRGALNENTSHIIALMQLNRVDALSYFAQISEQPDVVYLDPMYPQRKKSAKVKKEMQILQGLLTHDSSELLLNAALGIAKKRVVVKRPKGAEYLNDSVPSHSIESKKTRYDVYLCSI